MSERRPEPQARYSDGETAASHPALLTLTEIDLSITGQDGSRLGHWPFSALHSIDPWPIPAGPLRIGSETAPGARLTIFDPAFRDALLAKVPAAGRPPRRPLPRSLTQLTVLSLAMVAVALGLYAAAPWYAGPVSRLIPVSWEEQFGAGIKVAITDLFDWQVCTDPSGQAALEALVGRLTAGLASEYAFDVAVVDHKLVNALALPGGHLLLLRGLIDKARSADEVAGVVAHEIGHVLRRHSMVALVRSNARAILLDAVLGSSASIAQQVASAGNLALELRHSRQNEAEADRIAVDLLRQAGISTAGFKRFFEHLAEASGPNQPQAVRELLSYISTHPAVSARAAQIPDIAGEPGMTAAAWRALQGICQAR